MANRLGLLAAFARGAVDRQNELNADKQKEADKRKETQLAFARESYKTDLARYERLMQMKDMLAAQGRDGFASALVNNYNVKAGKGKEELTASVSSALEKDPEYMNKVLNAYGKIKKPVASDYFQNNEYDKIVKERINSEDAITNLLFAGRKGPSMLTSDQLKAQEEELLAKTGGRDFTAGFHEEMSGLGLGIKPSEAESKPPEKLNTEQAMVWYAVKGKTPPDALKSLYKDKIGGSDKPKTTTIAITNPDGSQDAWAISYKAANDGTISILDKENVTGKRPAAPVKMAPESVRGRALSFIADTASKEEDGILSKMLDSSNESVLTSLQAFRNDVADRVTQLQDLPEYRGKATPSELFDRAVKELSPGLKMKEGLPEYVPELVRDIFKEPTYERLIGEQSTVNEVTRTTKDGRKAVFDADTKQFIRWAE